MWKTIAICATIGAIGAIIQDRIVANALDATEEALKAKKEIDDAFAAAKGDNVYDFSRGGDGSFNFNN